MNWPQFPKARAGHIATTSPVDVAYNCVAWALGDNQNFIWPDEDEEYGWPPSLPRSPDLSNFTSFFELAGFEICELPQGDHATWEYVAIYAGPQGVEHAARQLQDGLWTSKLGDKVDICHRSTEDLENDEYGRATRFMRRRRMSTRYQLPPLHPGPPRLVTTAGAPLIR